VQCLRSIILKKRISRPKPWSREMVRYIRSRTSQSAHHRLRLTLSLHTLSAIVAGFHHIMLLSWDSCFLTLLTGSSSSDVSSFGNKYHPMVYPYSSKKVRWIQLLGGKAEGAANTFQRFFQFSRRGAQIHTRQAVRRFVQ